MDGMNWRTASMSSANGGECVETASGQDNVLVRDTKQEGRGPVLRVTAAEWRRFTDGLK